MAIGNGGGGSGSFYGSGSVTWGLYYLAGGNWTKAGSFTTGVWGRNLNQGWVTLSGSDTVTVTVPGGATAFRIIYEDQEGTEGKVTGGNASWKVTSSGGTRSATPSGQKITATMRPN